MMQDRKIILDVLSKLSEHKRAEIWSRMYSKWHGQEVSSYDFSLHISRHGNGYGYPQIEGQEMRTYTLSCRSSTFKGESEKAVCKWHWGRDASAVRRRNREVFLLPSGEMHGRKVVVSSGVVRSKLFQFTWEQMTVVSSAESVIVETME
jgi:hypothetical protein